jgi:hypothetical protein
MFVSLVIVNVSYLEPLSTMGSLSHRGTISDMRLQQLLRRHETRTDEYSKSSPIAAESSTRFDIGAISDKKLRDQINQKQDVSDNRCSLNQDQ